LPPIAILATLYKKTMAIIKNSIFGKFSGKVGEGIAYELNGQMVLRSVSTPKKDKPSEKQVLNRKKFTCTQDWLRPLTPFLRIGFMNYQPSFEGFVAAKSYNHNHAVKLDENNKFFVDPALALVSFGKQTLPITANAVYSHEEQEIVISWSTEGEYATTDLAMFLLYNIKEEYGIANTTAARRNKGMATYQLTKANSGSEYHIYLAFVADNRKNRSNSMYLGSLQIS
jgi:hypothetical protein